MPISYSIWRKPEVFKLSIIPLGWKNLSNVDKIKWVTEFVYEDCNFDCQYVGQRIKHIAELKRLYRVQYQIKHVIQNYVKICVNEDEFFDIPIEDVEEFA